MAPFETDFPEFIGSCARLYQAMMPWALAVLALSFAFEFWRGLVDVPSLTRFLAKLFFIVLLTAQVHQLINTGQLAVERLVESSGLVRPETLAHDFRERLAATVGDASIQDKSAAGLLWSGRFLDALLYAFLVIVSYICLGLVAFISFVQKMALLVSWACCPVLFALLAIPPVAQLGSAHIMRILAILCWPLGFAVAPTFSDGLLNLVLHDRALAGNSVSQNLGAAIESLLVLAVVGLWSIVSTILAPVFIQRFLVGYGGSARLVTAAGALGGLAAGALVPKLAAIAAGTVAVIRARLTSVECAPHASSDTPPTVPLLALPPPPVPPTAAGGPSPDAFDPTGSRRLDELLNSD
jgi:type IV secretion system protein TrbL